MPDSAAPVRPASHYGCQMFGLPSPEAPAPQPPGAATPQPGAAPSLADASLGADPPAARRPLQGWHDAGLAL